MSKPHGGLEILIDKDLLLSICQWGTIELVLVPCCIYGL